LNVGCIPSKALLNISHKYEESTKHFADFGLKATGVTYDWRKNPFFPLKKPYFLH